MSEKITNNNQLDKEKLSQIQYLNKVSYHSKPFVTNAYERGHASKANKPNIRRTLAYLNRLEKLIGSEAQKTEREYRNEKVLWEKAIESLVINPKDISDDYWRQQEQILRDNGQGRELSQREKDMLVQDIQQQQHNSAKAWADYLGQKDSPYPNWFKLYAWDGMSKLGVFDKNKNLFKKRDESTVAPYPGLNVEVLAKTYDVINDYLGGQKPDDEQLAKLVDEGGFNKIYSHLLMEQKIIVKTPERTEDIKGEWVEYDINSVAELAKAAEGTGWCISGEAVAKNYLKLGEYGNDEYDDEYDNNQARFILFHLEDPDTGRLAGNASASIRLDTNGQVAEISGLKTRQDENNQAVEDALVPIVEAKVKTLPGGEEFLPKLVDKEHLIAMDRKLKAGERFSQEDIEFIFEFHRPINQLDTYGNGDPRTVEFRRAVLDNLGHYKDVINIDQLVPKMNSLDITPNLDTLLKHGTKIDVNELISRMYFEDIARNLDTLLKHGAKIDQLVSEMYSGDIIRNINTLLKHGAKIDVNELISTMYPEDIIRNINTLLQHGVKIDVNELISTMYPEDIIDNLDILLQHGTKIDVNELISRMYFEDIARNLDILLQHGAKIDQLVSKIDSWDIARNLDILLQHGAKIDPEDYR